MREEVRRNPAKHRLDLGCRFTPGVHRRSLEGKRHRVVTTIQVRENVVAERREEGVVDHSRPRCPGRVGLNTAAGREKIQRLTLDGRGLVEDVSASGGKSLGAQYEDKWAYQAGQEMRM